MSERTDALSRLDAIIYGDKKQSLYADRASALYGLGFVYMEMELQRIFGRNHKPYQPRKERQE